jgi:NAD(P)-dependent dehydrogenase (short-subunit alcohol dehydrogenase family)
VAVASRTEDQVRSVAAEIEESGGTAAHRVCDVSRQEQVAALADAVRGEFGRIDVLVNCAGVFDLGPTVDFDPARARELFETNVTGTLLACRAAAPGMLARGRGKIVNFASLLSFTAFPGRAAYAASKGAVLQLTRALALEWAGGGVNVNAVAPGMIEIETPHPAIVSGALEPDAIVRRIPAGRRGRPRDIAGAVLFLCSDDADYIHGQTLVVDGGWLVNGYA